MSRHEPPPASGRQGRPVPLRLPPLSVADALRLVDLLERVLVALRRAYGDAIAEYEAGLGFETPRPRGARWAGRARRRDPDEDF
jgi:hypothetical protein